MVAIARLSVKVGKIGSAAPHAAYIARQGKYANRLEKGERLVATEAGNMPLWATDPLFFWDASDAHERKNGTTYREMEIALPRELGDVEQVELVREWVRQEMGDLHAYQWAIHSPKAADGGDQPHVHLMFSERRLDGLDRDPDQYFRRFNAKHPERGGARKGYGPQAGKTLSSAERAAELKELRASWEVMCNAYLEKAGSSERIDMRSHAERGTGLDPERKMRPSEWRGEGKSNVLEFRKVRAELSNAKQELTKLVPDLGAEIISLAVARQRREVATLDLGWRRSVDLMSSQEIANEIERLRPLPEAELVGQSPAVIEAKNELMRWTERYWKSSDRESQAGVDVAKWRESHPVKAGLHDVGITPSLDLYRLGKSREKARQEKMDLAQEMEDATLRVMATEKAELDRIRAEQAPIIAKLREMKKLLKETLLQERQAELYRRKASEMFLQCAHQRRQGTNASSYWQELPIELRELVDEFNRGSIDVKKMILAGLLDDPKLVRVVSRNLDRWDLGKDGVNLSR